MNYPGVSGYLLGRVRGDHSDNGDDAEAEGDHTVLVTLSVNRLTRWVSEQCQSV